MTEVEKRGSKLFLVGLPGSGKTTVGKSLANALGLTFYDLDECIVEKAQKSVATIFSEGGEKAFRRLEQQCLAELIQTKDNFVLSTGGGAPVYSTNMETMNESGVTIYLCPPISQILLRLTGEEARKRPMFAQLSDKDRQQKLESLYQDRAPYYEKASISISEVEPEAIVSGIISHLSSFH